MGQADGLPYIFIMEFCLYLSNMTHKKKAFINLSK